MDASAIAKPQLVFYSDFPLGYWNPEAENRMAAFAERGYRVLYVEMLGMRDPGFRHLGRVLNLLARGRSAPPRSYPFDTAAPKLLPGRAVPGLRRINERLVLDQLGARVADPAEAIAWVRFPTPEVVAAIERLEPRLVVYEQVDDHRSSADTPSLQRRFDDAERRVLDLASLVFAWSPPIAERLAKLHGDVVVMPAAGCDVHGLRETARQVIPRERTAVYVGSLDRRFDSDLMRDVVRLLPRWQFTLAGPDLVGVADVLRGASNVRLPGQIPPEDVPALVAGANVCLLPYRVNDFTNTLLPIKLIEYLAAGRPVVATPLRATEELTDAVEVAVGPEAFAEAVERAGRSDDEAARAARSERVASYDWPRLIDEMEQRVMAAYEAARTPGASSGARSGA